MYGSRKEADASEDIIIEQQIKDILNDFQDSSSSKNVLTLWNEVDGMLKEASAITNTWIEKKEHIETLSKYNSSARIIDFIYDVFVNNINSLRYSLDSDSDKDNDVISRLLNVIKTDSASTPVIKRRRIASIFCTLPLPFEEKNATIYFIANWMFVQIMKLSNDRLTRIQDAIYILGELIIYGKWTIYNGDAGDIVSKSFLDAINRLFQGQNIDAVQSKALLKKYEDLFDIPSLSASKVQMQYLITQTRLSHELINFPANFINGIFTGKSLSPLPPTPISLYSESFAKYHTTIDKFSSLYKDIYLPSSSLASNSKSYEAVPVYKQSLNIKNDDSNSNNNNNDDDVFQDFKNEHEQETSLDDKSISDSVKFISSQPDKFVYGSLFDKEIKSISDLKIFVKELTISYRNPFNLLFDKSDHVNNNGHNDRNVINTLVVVVPCDSHEAFLSDEYWKHARKSIFLKIVHVNIKRDNFCARDIEIVLPSTSNEYSKFYDISDFNHSKPYSTFLELLKGISNVAGRILHLGLAVSKYKFIINKKYTNFSEEIEIVLESELQKYKNAEGVEKEKLETSDMLVELMHDSWGKKSFIFVNFMKSVFFKDNYIQRPKSYVSSSQRSNQDKTTEQIAVDELIGRSVSEGNYDKLFIGYMKATKNQINKLKIENNLFQVIFVYYGYVRSFFVETLLDPSYVNVIACPGMEFRTEFNKLLQNWKMKNSSKIVYDLIRSIEYNLTQAYFSEIVESTKKRNSDINKETSNNKKDIIDIINSFDLPNNNIIKRWDEIQKNLESLLNKKINSKQLQKTNLFSTSETSTVLPKFEYINKSINDMESQALQNSEAWQLFTNSYLLPFEEVSTMLSVMAHGEMFIAPISFSQNQTFTPGNYRVYVRYHAKDSTIGFKFISIDIVCGLARMHNGIVMSFALTRDENKQAIGKVNLMGLRNLVSDELKRRKHEMDADLLGQIENPSTALEYGNYEKRNDWIKLRMQQANKSIADMEVISKSILKVHPYIGRNMGGNIKSSYTVYDLDGYVKNINDEETAKSLIGPEELKYVIFKTKEPRTREFSDTLYIGMYERSMNKNWVIYSVYDNIQTGESDIYLVGHFDAALDRNVKDKFKKDFPKFEPYDIETSSSSTSTSFTKNKKHGYYSLLNTQDLCRILVTAETTKSKKEQNDKYYIVQPTNSPHIRFVYLRDYNNPSGTEIYVLRVERSEVTGEDRWFAKEISLWVRSPPKYSKEGYTVWEQEFSRSDTTDKGVLSFYINRDLSYDSTKYATPDSKVVYSISEHIREPRDVVEALKRISSLQTTPLPDATSIEALVKSIVPSYMPLDTNMMLQCQEICRKEDIDGITEE